MAFYNCSDVNNNSYGASGYGTCVGTSQSVGAPNTGGFAQFLGSGSFTILIPLITAIIIVVIATVLVRIKKKLTKPVTVASLSPSHDE